MGMGITSSFSSFGVVEPTRSFIIYIYIVKKYIILSIVNILICYCVVKTQVVHLLTITGM